MNLNHLSITLPLTTNSTFTNTPHLSRVRLGAKNVPNDHLQKLPSSLLTHIMTYLNPYQICASTAISARLYDSFDESRWRPLCQQFFPESYKKHTESLESSPLHCRHFFSRHFFMSQFNFISGRLNFNAQQKSDFFLKGALNDDLLLLQNGQDKSLILWNTKEGRTVKQWIGSDPIQKRFTQPFLDKGSVLDGCAVFNNSSSITIHDLIGENKVITLPCKDSVVSLIAFGKSQIIYNSHSFELIGGERVCTSIWNIWNVSNNKTEILWSDAPGKPVCKVYVLDDEHIVTESAKALAVWHVASRQIIMTCTEATEIDIGPVILNKRWVVYTVPESDKKVKVWDTLTDKKSDLPIFSLPDRLYALNERLLICKMPQDAIKIIDVLEGHRQRDLPYSQRNLRFLPLSNGCTISFVPNQIAMWDDSAYQKELLKYTHSSTSSSSSDSSSSSSSSSSTSSSLSHDNAVTFDYKKFVGFDKWHKYGISTAAPTGKAAQLLTSRIFRPLSLVEERFRSKSTG